jgi:hypothetical protein
MIAFSALVARPVRAQEAPAPALAAQRPPELDHRHQVALALMPGLGYRIVVPYAENKTCFDDTRVDSKRVCAGGVPFFMDLQLAVGVSHRLDLMVDLRFGIAKENNAPNVGRQFALAPGIRYWLDPDVQLKFFTTLQVVYDSTKQSQIDISDTDYGIRNANGLMYDPIRNVGFYVQFGETIGFKRWFRIEVDAGAGVQVRFP